jgi:DNA-directed RNA polymerase beta subunit
MENRLCEKHIWTILENYFKNNGFVSHQIESFDKYIHQGIQKVVSEEPNIVIKNEKQTYTVSFGEVYIPSPSIIGEDRNLNLIFPNKARNEDLTYESPIYVDITETIEENDKVVEENFHKRIIIGKTPIMLRSSICNLSNVTEKERIKLGECEFDQGGYFIIKGKERVLVGQLHGIYNQVLVLGQKPSEKFKYIAEIRSISEETGHSVLIQAKIGNDDKTLVFSIPYIKEHIPIGIVFKALGYTDEEQIIDAIGLSGERVKKYIKSIIRDSYFITSQKDALIYIGQYSMHAIKEDKRYDYAFQVVETELFPHLGITASVKDKVYFLGHMVNKLLSTHLGLRSEDDRDNYTHKRVEMSGVLCCELFRTLFKRYIKSIEMQLEKKKFNLDVINIINRTNSITTGLRTCFAVGNWGIQKNSYVRTGVSQVLSRLTYGATLSHLRRLAIPIGKEGKNTKIRQINPSQIMYICPSESPEGAGAGIVLNLALMTKVTHRIPTVLVREIIEDFDNLIILNKYEGKNDKTKVFLNGILLGFTEDYSEFIKEFKLARRVCLIDKDISISYDEVDNEIKIYSDEGRLIRPLLTTTDGKLNIKESDGCNWEELLEKNLIQYVDNSEIENAVIAMTQDDLKKYKSDYCEIHPSMMLGVMASIIPFSDHTQCIDSNEPVYMKDGTSKKISDIEIGDEVITFDPINKKQSVSKVTYAITKPTKKQLYELLTISGRKIKATFDHQFMTVNGWKKIEEIDIMDDFVGISLEPISLSHNVEEKVILDEDKFINDCKKIGIIHTLSEKYKSKIKHLFPIKNNSENIVILSRLYGYFLADFSKNGPNNYVRMFIDFDDEYSAELFAYDLKQIDIDVNLIPDRIISEEENNILYRIKYDSYLVSLLFSLGIDGEKNFYKNIPSWILEGTDLVKREFLAGLNGRISRDGYYIHNKTEKIIIKNKFWKNSIKNKNILEKFINEIASLVKSFDIQVFYILKEDGDTFYMSYDIYDTPDNIIKYYDTIGYRYAAEKNVVSGKIVEFLKYNKFMNNKVDLEEWMSNISSSSTTIFVPLLSKTKVDNFIISDITVDSLNQSFLCGDRFCVHNSPRVIYQSSMGKQALGIHALSHNIRTDTITYVLDYPQKPIVSTIPSKLMGFNDMPSGINAIVAIMCYSGLTSC